MTTDRKRRRRLRRPGARAIIQRANQIKLTRPRHFPGEAPRTSRLFTSAQLDQAVNLIRRRGVETDLLLLDRAGYARKARR
jgi:hypothetical protein